MRMAIIGSGFAGLSAAASGLDNYEQVVVFSSSDRNIKVPENGWGELLGSMSKTCIEEDDEGVIRRVEELEWMSDEMSKNLEMNDSYVIDRSILQANWLRQLEEDGVEIRLNEVIDQERFEDICDSFDIVIDASGPSPVSESILDIPRNEKYQLDTISSRKVRNFNEHPKTAVGSFKKKFYWINTRSENQATVGAVTKNIPDAERAKSSLVDRLEDEGVIVKNEDLNTGKIPFLGYREFDDSTRKHHGAELRLVGDAAGLANGITGFGLQRAFESGKAAASLERNKDYVNWLRSTYRIAKMYDHSIGVLARTLGWRSFAKYMNITGRNITYPESTDPRTKKQFIGALADILTR